MIDRFVKFVYLILFLIKSFFSKKSLNSDYNIEFSKLRILANGPSLKYFLSSFKPDSDFEYMCMNFFPVQKEFFILKPKFLCFADPMFFNNSHRFDEVKNLFVILNNQVDWELIIFVPANKKKAFLAFSKLLNKNVKIEGVNTSQYLGLERFRFSFYKNNLAMPGVYTVANLAIFIGINLKFDEIEVFGIDHTFFDSLVVTSDNVLCNRSSHFYSSDSDLKPIIRNDNSENYRISEYVLSAYNMFNSHDVLSEYSKYCNVRIFNCSGNSLVDSYLRKNISFEV